jgi:hypothetical protein
MKTTIWINRNNEEFWLALENKSGWVNMVIEALLEENDKRRAIEDAEED